MISTSEEVWPRKRLISAREYLRMAEAELLPEHGVELIAGEIYELPPFAEPVARVYCNTVGLLITGLNAKGFDQLSVRTRSAIDGGQYTWPEPDIAVVRDEFLNLEKPPSQAVLIVETSPLALQYNRTTKASLYASLGIADYWIVNLINSTVEVHRQPIESQESQFGWNYASRQIYQRGQSIALLEVPTVSLAVDEMLP